MVTCNGHAKPAVVLIGMLGSIEVANARSNVEQPDMVTGSRATGKSVEESKALDYIFADDLLNQGDNDLANLLRTTVPSINVNTQPISDAGTIVRPVNLRGLQTH